MLHAGCFELRITKFVLREEEAFLLIGIDSYNMILPLICQISNLFLVNAKAKLNFNSQVRFVAQRNRNPNARLRQLLPIVKDSIQ